MMLFRRLLAVMGLGAMMLGCASRAPKEEEAPEPAPAAVETAVVKSGDVWETIKLDGTFSTPEGKAAKLAAVGPGRLTKVLVKEGDHFRAGQLLAVVDLGVQNAQASSADAALASANATTTQAEFAYRAAVADNRNAVESARLSVDQAIADRKTSVTQAEIELNRLKNGARPQELASSEQSVRQAKVNRDRAKLDADRDAELFKKGYIAGSQADNSKAALDVAESALKQAELQLDLVRAGARREEFEAADEKLRSAKELGDKRISLARTALRLAEQGSMSVRAKASEMMATRLAAKQKASDAMAAKQTIRNAEIRAPWDGVVMRRLMNPGDVADTTTIIMELAASDAQIDFVGSLAAPDASQTSVGQEVTFENIESLVGRVKSVGQANPVSGLVPVRIHCDAMSPKAIAGTFGTASIRVAHLRNVCTVPIQCVLTREQKSMVFVLKDGAAKLTEVVTGPEVQEFISIRKGLQPGQVVILLGQHELTDGAKVEPIKR